MRRLIFVPARHSSDEVPLGVSETLKFLPETDQQDIADTTNSVWESIYEGVEALGLDFRELKVFAEAATEEEPVVKMPVPFAHARKVAENTYKADCLEARQHAFILSLWLAGARIMKTENSVFYNTVENMVSKLPFLVADVNAELEKGENLDEPIDDDTIRRIDQLLLGIDSTDQSRDESTAEAINTQLKDGEIGMLVMGLDHRVIERLDGDIIVEFISVESRELYTSREGQVTIHESFRKMIEEEMQGRHPERGF